MQNFDPQPEERRSSRIPNYRNRSIQIRIAMMVFMVMGVFVMMDKVRKPESWDWMGFEKPEQPFADKSIDTRVNPLDINSKSSQPLKIEVGPTENDLLKAAEERKKREAISIASKFNSEEELKFSEFTETAEDDFWVKAYSKLNENDKTAIFLALRSVRKKTPLSRSTRLGLAIAIEKIDLRRQQYYTKIMRWLETLRDEDEKAEKNRWLDVLADMKKIWDGGFCLQLREISKSELLPEQTPIGLQMFRRMQTKLDQIATSYVLDNSLNSKDNDMQTWYRLFDILSESDDDSIKAQSLGYVSHVQLYEQPALHRGKIVSVKGTIKGAYTVDAPQNEYGIEKYFVFWIRPADRSNNPIAIYSLEKPPGFPTVKSLAEQGELDDWNESVEVHGFFLKKWVYVSKDANRICPLILSQQLLWYPKSEELTAEVPVFSIGLLVVGIALLAFLVAAYVYWSSNRSIKRDELPVKIDNYF